MAGRTAEQGRPSPDIAFLQERGGLTIPHWQEIVRRIGEPKDPIRTKVVGYGQEVMAGELPDSGFHHREYLGRRHWQSIANLGTVDKIRIPRKLPPWPKTIYRENELAREAREYAALEEQTIFTLDDHLDINLRVFRNINREKNMYWYRRHTFYHKSYQGQLDIPDDLYEFHASTGRWYIIETKVKEVPETPGGNLPATSSNWEYYDGGIEVGREPRLITDEGQILNPWLLTKVDVQDPLHRSPKELESLIRTGVPVEVLNERLRKYLDIMGLRFQSMGGWEKEVR